MPVGGAALEFGDVAEITATYLRAALAAAGSPVRVGTKVPNPRPDQFVRVKRTGGAMLNPVIDAAQVTIEAWALTDHEAADLAALARRLVEDMAGTVQSGESIHRVRELGGPADLPDPVSNMPRMTFTVQIQMRGRRAA